MNTKLPPKPKVFLPIISYDGRIHAEFALGLIQTICASPAEFETLTVAQAGIALVRNWTALHFLKKTKADYLFFIDTDISFRVEQVQRILGHCVTGGQSIVAGMYPKKSKQCRWCLTLEPGEQPAPGTSLMKVRHAATGFLCIHRRVFEAIQKKYPERRYSHDLVHAQQLDEGYDFFPMGAREGEYETEDWAFCRLARECGFDVMVDTTVQLGHIGEAMYPAHRSWADHEIDELLRMRYGAGLSTLFKNATAG